MATIDNPQALEAMRGIARALDGGAGEHVTWTKAQAKAALQALEDYHQATAKAGFAAAIEAAAPGVFNNRAKKALGRWYFHHRFKVDAR